MRFITLVLVTLSFAFSTPSMSSDSYAIVKKIRGVAKVNNKELKEGDRIEIGSIINARGKGNFIDIEIKPNHGAVRIVNGEFELKKISNTTSIYNLLFGKAFSYFNKTDKSNIQINTKQASFSVRGTKFLAEQLEDDRSFLCVCDGVVEAKNSSGKSANVKAGEEVFITKNDPKFVDEINMRDMTKLKSIFKDMGYPVK